MRYYRMNGLGNDFIVLDARGGGPLRLPAAEVRRIADRSAGGGCDQLIAIEDSGAANAFMRIWNADGGEVSACGNAARCVAWLLMEEGAGGELMLETEAGRLMAVRRGPLAVQVDMGAPRLDWREIPVARQTDTVAMDYSIEGPGDAIFAGPGGVNMGNPHAVFFVADADAAPVSIVGPRVEIDPFFPERVNVGFAEIHAPDRIRLRVWERGAGLTRACGSGACAALVAAHRAGRAGRKATLLLDGGALEIEWRESDGHVLMTGPVALDGEGDLSLTVGGP